MPQRHNDVVISDSSDDDAGQASADAKPAFTGGSAKRRISFSQASNGASDSDYESASDSSDSDAGRAGRAGNSDEEDDEDEDGREFELDAGHVGLTADELRDAQVELWLMRVPRHQSLDDNLFETSIELPARGEPACTDRICGKYRGSYAYRDHGAVLDKSVRAAFVVPRADNAKKGEILVSKPFSKMISVTYDAELVDLSTRAPPKRTYPEEPQNLSQKYFPVGGTSKKRRLEEVGARKENKREPLEVHVQTATPVSNMRGHGRGGGGARHGKSAKRRRSSAELS